MNRMKIRMKRELEKMDKDPPSGITCWSVEDNFSCLKASILGHDDSPYEKGVFHLDINLTDRYPFEPPVVKFETPVYHPNIDSGGRICLDLLKMPPKGSWKPSVNISSLLQSIQILMTNPNPEDPLMADIAKEFRTNKQKYLENARAWTLKYAIADDTKLNQKRKSLTCIDFNDSVQPKTRKVLEGSVEEQAK